MRFKSLFIIFFFLFFHNEISAQDPTFSQFYANRNYLNPAFTGMHDGISFTFSNREQWLKIPRRYSTASASIEFKPCYWPMAFGLYAFKDKEGNGLFLNQGGGVNYSHVFAFGKNVNVHFGTRLGFTSKGVEWNNLHFSDEIDPVYGFVTPTNAQPIYDNINIFDMDFGTVLRFKLPSPGFRKTDIKSAIGFSYNHFFEPINSLYDGQEFPLPKRLTFHAGTQIPVATANKALYKEREDRKYYIIPNFKADFQFSDSIALNRTFSWGAYIETPLSLYAGFFYQHSYWTPNKGEEGGLNAPSFIIVAGFEAYILDGIPVTIGLSYDTQPLGLPTSVSGGSLEISLRCLLEAPRMMCNSNSRAKRWNRKTGRYIMDCNKFF